MEAVRKFIEAIIHPTSQEWDYFFSLLQTRVLQPKEIVVKEGVIAEEVFFVQMGLLRTYQNLDGRQISTYLACDGQFISTFSSFITQTPAHECLEAIEDSTVYTLSHTALQQVYLSFPRFEKLGRLLAESNYLCVVDRIFAMQTKTAKEKYLDFIKTYPPKVVQRTPQHMIASFLGIAPESLSRIRRELAAS